MIIHITQRILWLVLKPTLGVFIKYKIYGKENLNIKEPVIIVMNHKSALDAFLFGVNLSLGSNIWPMRFFVSTKEFKTPILSFLNSIKLIDLAYAVFGHFYVIKGAGLDVNLKKPIEFLKKSKKGSVVIFPEGERVFEKDKIRKGKRGAAALAIASKRKILPVAIKNSQGRKIYNFWKEPVIINIGKPFLLQDLGGSRDQRYKKETDVIMDKIKELYFSV